MRQLLESKHRVPGRDEEKSGMDSGIWYLRESQEEPTSFPDYFLILPRRPRLGQRADATLIPACTSQPPRTTRPRHLRTRRLSLAPLLVDRARLNESIFAIIHRGCQSAQITRQKKVRFTQACLLNQCTVVPAAMGLDENLPSKYSARLRALSTYRT